MVRGEPTVRVAVFDKERRPDLYCVHAECGKVATGLARFGA